MQSAKSKQATQYGLWADGSVGVESLVDIERKWALHPVHELFGGSHLGSADGQRKSVEAVPSVEFPRWH